MIKKILSLSLILALIGVVGFSGLEPGLVGAQVTDSDSVDVSLTVDEEIVITDAANVTMAPNLGVSANKSVGSATWNVKTNAQLGYNLAVRASTSPALRDSGTGEEFTDYTEDTPGVPDQWSVDASSYEFGFSAVGDDVETEHNDADGGGGTAAATSCPSSANLGTTNNAYEGFTTSDEQIATSASETTTSGTDTTICFGAEQNGIYAPNGTYVATITATATTN